MSAYRTLVESTSGLLYYWPLKLNSGTAAKGGANATLTNSTSVAAGGGPLESPATDEGSTEFNGTTARGQATINLSAIATLTLEFWLWTSAFDLEDDLAFEYTANANSNNGFYIDPNTSGTEANGGGQFTAKWRMGEKNRVYRFARPSTSTWHLYSLTMIKNGALKAYIDGAEVTATAVTAEAQTGSYASSVLNMMSRNGAALFQKGKLNDVAIYEGELSKATVEGHYAARKEAEAGGGASKGLAMIL